MQSHKVFTPSQAPFFVDKVGKYGVGRIRQYTGVQFAPSEYEKYGYLANSNKAAGVPSKYAGMYGDVTARFKKSQVQCTWTADDSLETKGDIFMQPSLTTKPSIVSFGHALPQKVKAKDLDFSSPEAFVKSAHTRYIELQYHGRLTMDMVESLTFAKDPKTILSARTIAELKLKKIDLYYKVVEDGKTIVKKYEYESQR